MIKKMSINFLENKYLSKTIISAIPEKDDKWSLHGFKLAYLIACEMSKDRFFIERNSKILSLDDEKILKHIKSVQRKFIVTRDDFQRITGVSRPHIARAIKLACNDLMKKNVILSNPLDPDNPRSFKMLHWFSEAEYHDNSGEITIEVDPKMLPYMLVLVTYTRLDYTNISNLQNIYAARVYLICKIAQNKHREELKINISLKDFKQQIGLIDKYKDNAMFKARILDIVASEINKKTDLHFNYKLYKNGKKFTDIEFCFSSKKTNIKTAKKNNIKEEKKRILKQDENESVNLSYPDIKIKMKAYNIKSSVIEQLIKIYGERVCEKGLKKLLFEIKKGTQIKNTAGYLIKCIENYENSINSAEVSMAIAAEKEVKRKQIEAKQERFREFDRYISRNEQDILPLIIKYKANEKLFDDAEINMLESLRELIHEYQDIAENTMSLTMVSIVTGKTNLLTYKIISDIANGLVVANNQERISLLKKDLTAKELELSKAKGKIKTIIEKELFNIKIKIADLVM